MTNIITALDRAHCLILQFEANALNIGGVRADHYVKFPCFCSVLEVVIEEAEHGFVYKEGNGL